MLQGHRLGVHRCVTGDTLPMISNYIRISGKYICSNFSIKCVTESFCHFTSEQGRNITSGEASQTFGHANANFSVFIDRIRGQFLKKCVMIMIYQVGDANEHNFICCLKYTGRLLFIYFCEPRQSSGTFS